MNDSTSHPDPDTEPSREEMMAAHFANLVMQHTQLGLMLTGKTPRPDSGKTVQDLDHARLVIDQLEMLEAKTKGNLNKDEQGLLNQSLMTLRLAFVEAVESAPPETKPDQAASGQSAPAPSGGEPPASPPAADEESRKKFSKKY